MLEAVVNYLFSLSTEINVAPCLFLFYSNTFIPISKSEGSVSCISKFGLRSVGWRVNHGQAVLGSMKTLKPFPATFTSHSAIVNLWIICYDRKSLHYWCNVLHTLHIRLGMFFHTACKCNHDNKHDSICITTYCAHSLTQYVCMHRTVVACLCYWHACKIYTVNHVYCILYVDRTEQM